MFFTTTRPAFTARAAFHPARRMPEQAMAERPRAGRTPACEVTQDETSYTLAFDVPGVSREQLSIGVEGSVVRIDTVAQAPRSYRAACELPTDLDVASSQARLENGVLTVRLAKQAPASKVTKIVVN